MSDIYGQNQRKSEHKHKEANLLPSLIKVHKGRDTPRNPGCPLDLEWINSIHVNLTSVKEVALDYQTSVSLKNNYQAAWLLKALTCIDLTTLSGDDTESNVRRLCFKAANPLSEDLILALGFDKSIASGRSENRITTAAVCVYPNQVSAAANYLEKINLSNKIQVASVAAGFPSGQYPLKTRIEEIQSAVASGATEIDIVINRGLVLNQEWGKLYHNIVIMREACGEAHLKTILSVGELGTFTNIFKASLVAMMAGSDFIKTSTGKEGVNATLPIGVVMCRAIRDYHRKTGVKVGLKPAGGLRTSKDALDWLFLVHKELGHGWLNPTLFRIGASGLLTDIERQLFHRATGKYANANDFTMG